MKSVLGHPTAVQFKNKKDFSGNLKL